MGTHFYKDIATCEEEVELRTPISTARVSVVDSSKDYNCMIKSATMVTTH